MEDISFQNVQLETNGGATIEDIDGISVPELDLEYLDGWWAGIYTYDRDGVVVPSHGIYARHVDGLYLDNMNMLTRNSDERPAIYLDDVTNYHGSSLKVNGKELKMKFIMYRVTKAGRCGAYVHVNNRVSIKPI